MPLRLQGPSSAALSATFVRPGSVGDRLRKASASAFRRNAIDLGVMATPPTIATGVAVLDAALTNSYRTQTVGLTPYRITGGTPTQGLGGYAPYVEAPVVTMPSGSGGNVPGMGTKNQYQWAVEFWTDAPKVQLRYFCTTATYMVEVDDQPVSAATLAYPATTGTGYTTLDFGSSAVRKVRVEFVTAAALDGVYVGPTYRIWAPKSDTNVRVCTVGDSIDTGIATTLASSSWQKVAGKLLGWTDVRQVSFGGTGFVNAGTYNTFGSAQRIADAVATNPDLLIIQASQNDDAQAGLQAAALATFQAYRTALPSVPIIVLGAHAGSSGPSTNRVNNEAAVKAAFTQWGDSKSWFLPITASTTDSWESGTGTVGAPTGTGNRDRFGTDSAHANDLGHRYYGQRFANAFRETVLSAIA